MEGPFRLKGSSEDPLQKNYEQIRNIGHGSFGKVKAAKHRLTGIRVAIKILNRKKMREERMEEKVSREIKIGKLLEHPHIIRLYEIIETLTDVYVVMEYAERGELYDYIVENIRIREDEARKFFQQIISGLEYCHKYRVVHRDLKPENLLLDCNGNVKIADFGLSNIMRDGYFLKTSCGSPNYAAPEVISGKLYVGPEVDVWSCGITLYVLLCGALPFEDESISHLLNKVKSGVYTLPSHLTTGARDLIERMIVVDPLKRITIPEIGQHPWFLANLPYYLATALPDITHHMKKGLISSALHGGEFSVSVAQQLIEHQATQSPSVGRWGLGFQFGLQPHHIMVEVLNALRQLNVCWKKIGHYNIKCMWSRGGQVQGATKNCQHDGLHLGNESATIQTNQISKNTVKFELQLYKTCEENYLLDLQRLTGPQVLFIDLCASFLARLHLF